MAALRVVEESPNQLVLGTPLRQRLPNLLSLLVFLFVGWSIISSLLGGGFGEDPASVLILIFFAFFGLRTVYSFLVTTGVKIDGTARLATRTTSLLGFPIGQVALPLDRVRRVIVGSRMPVGFNQARTRNGWLVTLEATDGPPFVANWNGTHDEMLSFGNKVAALVNKPLADELERASAETQPAPDFQPIQDFGGGASTPYAPPVALPSPMGGQMPAAQLPEKAPPPNTLTPDSESPDHARFEQEASQAAPSYNESVGMGGGAAPPSYSAPPALELPDQAPLGSVPPTPTAIPSVPSAVEERATSAPPRRRTIEELQKAIADDPTDSVAYYQLARALQSRGASDQGLEMYQNAVRLDPMNGYIQNDLGVLYFQRGKLKEAELAFRRAVGLDPFAVMNHLNLGLLLARTGRRQDAEQEFSRVQQNASTDMERQLAAAALNGRVNTPVLSGEG